MNVERWRQTVDIEQKVAEEQMKWIACMTVALALMFTTDVRADQVDDYVKLQMERQRIPGVSLAVVKDGQIVKLQSYGLANIELNVAASSDTVYKIGSLSKPFIATGVMLLAADGKLALTDEIVKFLDGAPDGWNRITVQQVLSHSSGLARDAPGFDPLKLQRDADVIRSAYGVALAFSPGERWQYSNLGYFVLAEIISKASGKAWPEFLAERVFRPLGMAATRVTDMTAIVPNRASGYVVRNGRYQNAPLLLAVRPSGALLSNVTDLLRWDAALSNESVLPQSTLEAMWTPAKPTNGETARYGLGWQLDGEGNDRMIHHPGSIAGFQADYVRFPEYKLSVIVLANQDVALPVTIAVRVATLYEPKLVPPRIPVQMNPAVLAQYVGRYRLGRGGMLAVEFRGGALRMHSDTTGADALLQPESPISFFADSGDPRLRYVFQREPNGRVTGISIVQDDREVNSGALLP
jgi:D-alanyl-D-alanine carboxypeptidase